MATPGVEVRPLRQMTGGSEFDEVFLTDVELPADALLGPLHGGWGVGMAVLTSERGHIGASVIGLERRLAALAAVGRRRGRCDGPGRPRPPGRAPHPWPRRGRAWGGDRAPRPPWPARS